LSLDAQSGSVKESSAPAFIENLMPALYNGYLYTIRPRHVLTLFAPDGHQMLTLPLIGNDTVSILNVAIDSDTTLALSRRDEAGAAIELRDAFGNLLQSINTGRYIPAHVAFGEDHTIWSLGWQTDATKLLYPDRQDYMILRHYSRDGKEIGAYLPRSLFPVGLEPGRIGWQSRAITITGDRIGVQVYSGNPGNKMEWVELNLDGKLTGRWRLDDVAQGGAIAFTSDDHAYLPHFDLATKTHQVLKLNHATSTWEKVPSPPRRLYGSDGDQLVFAEWGGRGWDGLMHLSWFKQP
jgi:hypothetical protein